MSDFADTLESCPSLSLYRWQQHDIMTQWHWAAIYIYICENHYLVQIRIVHAHSSIPVPWHGRWNIRATLCFTEREVLDTYIMCMRALQLAGKEREDGKDRKRGRGSDRKRGRGRALVLAEFIEVGVKKCYTCSKHTDENPHTKPGQHILSSSSLTRSKITIKQPTNNNNNGCRSVPGWVTVTEEETNA